MRRAAEGAGTAFHLAALYRMGMGDVAEMERSNVEGTRRFLEVTEEAGVARRVHVSSTVALAPASTSEHATPGARQGPYPSEYHRTKAESHRLALAAQQRGEPVIIACPGFVYGPGDEGPALLYMMDLLRHRVPGLSTRPAWFTYVHVDDVVQGLMDAADRGALGGVYVLGGERASVNDYSRMVGRVAGTWVSPLRFPPVVVGATGVLMDGVTRLTGVRMPISRELARVAGTGAREDHPHARAAADFGYSARSLAEGLPETVRDVQERLSH
jgi:dihydroflavonol-4-reductase